MRDQRLEFLEQLGAQHAKTESMQKVEDTAPAGHPHPEQCRPVRDFDSSQRLRFRFGKLDSAIFLGHGDMIRELPRMLRRAGLRLKYSEGFHPKPELSFAPALSLGIPSLDEYFDAEVIDPPPIAEVLPRLALEQNTGIWFRGAARLGKADPGLSKLVRSAHYALLIPSPTVEALGGESQLEQRIAEFMTRETAMVERRKEKSTSQIDARRFVERFQMANEATIAAAALFTHAVSCTVCDLVVSLGQSGSVKPREVWGAMMLPELAQHALAIRIALLDDQGEQLFKRHVGPDWFEAPQWSSRAN
jgi:radical SAM-linked protein